MPDETSGFIRSNHKILGSTLCPRISTHYPTSRRNPYLILNFTLGTREARSYDFTAPGNLNLFIGHRAATHKTVELNRIQKIHLHEHRDPDLFRRRRPIPNVLSHEKYTRQNQNSKPHWNRISPDHDHNLLLCRVPKKTGVAQGQGRSAAGVISMNILFKPARCFESG